MVRQLLLFAIAVVVVGMIGCSGSGGDPVGTSPEPPDLTAAGEQTSELSEPSGGHNLLGYWSILLDEETGVVELVPMRTTGIHLNLVRMLEGGTMNISLGGKPEIIAGLLHVDVRLQHPFPGKLQFSGFDVKGILISHGSETGFSDPEIRIAGPGETRLINADGFTRWWNPAEFLNPGWFGYTPGKLGGPIDPASAAILNGYKLFADGFSKDAAMSELDPATRALFAAGAINTRHYVISLAGGAYFNYAVDASWDTPDPNPPVNLPEDFPINANQPEPWFIEVTETNNTLWYEDTEHGGNVNYDLVVHDWQGVDDIGTLTFECPGLFSFTAEEPLSTTSHTASYHFDAILPEIASTDPLDVLITVEVPGDYQTALTGVDKPLCAYHRHLTLVSDENPVFNMPPVALMEATTPTDIYVDETVSFDGTASYDPDGYITQYLWDFNGNGIYGEESYDGEPETPTYTYTESGDFEVSLKVRDDKGSTDTSDSVIVHVTMLDNDPPIAVAEATTPTDILEDETVSFDGAGSYDLDGVVVDWQWDFNGDGTYGDAYEGDMETPTALFPDPGTFYVDLKVIDNEAGWGVLEHKIKVEVEDVPNVPPVAVAVATTPTDIDLCGSVTFDATGSYDTDGTIEQYLWDFDGDGTFGDLYESGTDENPTKFFNDVGEFNVQLKVIDNESAEDVLDDPIVVTTTNVPPTAAFEASALTIYNGDSVTFDASLSVDPDCDDLSEYLWDFDADSVYGDPYDSGTDDNPTKIYPDPGVFQVRLKVIDGQGAEDVTAEPVLITVLNHPPTACAEITTEWPYVFETDIYFSAECSEDVDGTIVSWEWDLGADGSYEKSGETVSYYFDSAGDYTVQLKVTDNGSDWSLLDEALSFHVYDDTSMPPVITAVTHSRTTSEKGNMDEWVQLGVEFVDIAPPGDTHTFLWSCDYGSFDNETSQTPIWYPPDEVVICDITVRVNDGEGWWDEDTCRQWVTKWPALTNNPNAPEGCKIISYTMESVFDGMVDPVDFTGNVVYMNFFATWCPPCVGEMPELYEIYQEYRDQDYAHLIIDYNESKSIVESFVISNGYEATHWLLDPAVYFWQCNDWNGDSNGIPQHLVFDRDGRCRGQRVGSIGSLYDLTKFIDELI